MRQGGDFDARMLSTASVLWLYVLYKIIFSSTLQCNISQAFLVPSGASQ